MSRVESTAPACPSSCGVLGRFSALGRDEARTLFALLLRLESGLRAADVKLSLRAARDACTQPTPVESGSNAEAFRGRCAAGSVEVFRRGGVQLAERVIEANGVGLCTESFGEPADPPILLVMGIGASMLWWEEGFCQLLAEGGRFVIRYDHRDTGRSTSHELGRPGYTGADLVADAVGVLDGYELVAAHLVGVSAGGAFAQQLALGFPDRVLSLALISTSPATC